MGQVGKDDPLRHMWCNRNRCHYLVYFIEERKPILDFGMYDSVCGSTYMVFRCT